MSAPVPFADLKTCDLAAGTEYLAGPSGGLGEEPLGPLLKVGNMGGIRYRGTIKNCEVVALYSTMSHALWKDRVDERSGVVAYHGDNEQASSWLLRATACSERSSSVASRTKSPRFGSALLRVHAGRTRCAGPIRSICRGRSSGRGHRRRGGLARREVVPGVGLPLRELHTDRHPARRPSCLGPGSTSSPTIDSATMLQRRTATGSRPVSAGRPAPSAERRSAIPARAPRSSLLPRSDPRAPRSAPAAIQRQ